MTHASHHHGGYSRRDLVRRAAGLAFALAGADLAFRTPSAARAATPDVTSRELQLGPGRTPAGVARVLSVPGSGTFHLAGVHWRGAGAVWLRAKQRRGGWTPWTRAVPHELPDPGSEESTVGWELGTPVWTGEAIGLELHVAGPVDAVRSYVVSSPPFPLRRLARAEQPSVIARAEWGADETIVKGEPALADRLVLAIVHHTAGTRPASPEESAQVVRAIQTYHVEANGWNDIGYNALVDPFGQVFEGRRGGIDRNVIGAHALGFNTGSVGVALLGNYETRLPAPEALAGLNQFLAWRLDVAHIDPVAQVAYVSGGTVRSLRAISGHRDVNPTDCPGGELYPELDGVAQQAALLGLPKLYEPSVDVSVPAGAAFSARLSSALPWTVTVTDSLGTEVARGAGEGAAVSWTWDATGAPAATYRYTIDAGPDVLPAFGAFALGAGAPVEQPPPRPERPAGVPRRVPSWAWQLRLWHLTPSSQRGPRPAAAPRRPPHWYWQWLAWRRELGG